MSRKKARWGPRPRAPAGPECAAPASAPPGRFESPPKPEEGPPSARRGERPREGVRPSRPPPAPLPSPGNGSRLRLDPLLGFGRESLPGDPNPWTQRLPLPRLGPAALPIPEGPRKVRQKTAGPASPAVQGMTPPAPPTRRGPRTGPALSRATRSPAALVSPSLPSLRIGRQGSAHQNPSSCGPMGSRYSISTTWRDQRRSPSHASAMTE